MKFNVFFPSFLYLCRWNSSQPEWLLRHPCYRCSDRYRSWYDQWSFYQKAWCGHNRKPTGGVLFPNSLMYGNSIFSWTSTYKALLFPVSWPSFSWCITFGISSFWLHFSFALVVRRSAIPLKHCMDCMEHCIFNFNDKKESSCSGLLWENSCMQWLVAAKVSLIDKFSFSSFGIRGC